MRKLLLLSLPLYLALAGCGIRSHNVTFTWSFEGGRKCSDVGITSVTVKIPGQSLQNGGVYPCNPGGNAADGVTLLRFAPGAYTYELDASDSSGTVFYVATGSFTVRADTQVPVDFQYSGTTLHWDFAAATGAAPFCGTGTDPTLDMDAVELDVDKQPMVQFACEAGLVGKGQGVSSPYLTPGVHTIQLFAYNHLNPNLAYAASQAVSINVVAGQPPDNTLGLNWQVGGLFVVFSDVSNNTCVQDGLSNTSINFVRAADHSLLFGASGDIQAACSTTPNAVHGFNEFNYPVLPADTYYLTYTAPSSTYGGTFVEQTQPTTIIIGAGNFGAPASPLHVPLTHQP